MLGLPDDKGCLPAPHPLQCCRYMCYTCGLQETKGCCSACAAVCHAGHDLVYSAYSRFFCDCGAGVPG